jgi:hypothetical protein
MQNSTDPKNYVIFGHDLSADRQRVRKNEELFHMEQSNATFTKSSTGSVIVPRETSCM